MPVSRGLGGGQGQAGRFGRLRGAAVLTAVVLLVGVSWMVGSHGDGERDLPTHPVARSAAPEPSPPVSGAPALPTAPDSIRAVILGDSYTVGVGASEGYVSDLALLMGWDITGAGEAGTGYVNSSDVPGRARYAERLPVVVEAAPDIVLVQGSTNDGGVPPEELRAAAGELYRALHASLPDARIVVVGPLRPPTADPGQVDMVRSVLASAAAQAGLPFIDPVAQGWLSPGDGLFADGLHPDDAGYDQLALRLAGDLHALGL